MRVDPALYRTVSRRTFLLTVGAAVYSAASWRSSFASASISADGQATVLALAESLQPSLGAPPSVLPVAPLTYTAVMSQQPANARVVLDSTAAVIAESNGGRPLETAPVGERVAITLSARPPAPAVPPAAARTLEASLRATAGAFPVAGPKDRGSDPTSPSDPSPKALRSAIEGGYPALGREESDRVLGLALAFAIAERVATGDHEGA